MKIIVKLKSDYLNINNIKNENHNITNIKLGNRVLYEENNNIYISYIFNNDFSQLNILNNTIEIYDELDSKLYNYYSGYSNNLDETKDIRNFILNNSLYNSQRKDVLSKDEYFMLLAVITAFRSKDPNTQVGATIVSDKGRILSVGYNGTPNGYPDNEFPWDREGNILNTKYASVCHAELNAILNFDGDKKDLLNSTLYVDLFPCNKCAVAIIQSGIKNVIYSSDKYANTDDVLISKHLFDKCNVSYNQMVLDKEKILKKILKRGK